MKQFCSFPHIASLLFMLAVTTACSAQPNSNALKNNNPGLAEMLKVDAQIDEYVVELFEDSKFKSVFILMKSRTSSNKVRILYCGKVSFRRLMVRILYSCCFL